VGGTYKRCAAAQSESTATPFPAIMLPPPPDDPMSIFVDGKLKPGTYKVQNLAGQTYLEVEEYSKELCCRPATVLAPQDALVISRRTTGPRKVNVPDAFTVGISSVGVRIQHQEGAQDRHLQSLKSVVTNDLELGQTRKARSILQWISRDGTLMVRRYSLSCAVPDGMEGRNRR